MRGNQEDEPTNQVFTKVNEEIPLGTPGIAFQIESTWARQKRLAWIPIAATNLTAGGRDSCRSRA